jgi:aminoglycoside 6'-N-acetyltransferase
MVELQGELVRLRSATASDAARIVEIRSTPEVHEWWRGDDLDAEFDEDMVAEDSELLAIEDDTGHVVGAIQWHAEEEPDYRHAGIDIYLDPAAQGRGLCTDAVRTMARHLFSMHGHHRLTIDPAAHNAAAIACYSKVGFRPVGVMRQYERGLDGAWHDGLLMELLAEDFAG